MSRYRSWRGNLRQFGSSAHGAVKSAIEGGAVMKVRVRWEWYLM